jgi:hypothetical protein
MSAKNFSQEYATIQRPAKQRTSRPRGSIALGAIGGVAIVAILLTAASAAAAPVATAAKHTAPYTGQANQAAFWSNSGCGGSFDLKKLPEFNLTKGTFVGSETAKASTCGSTGSSMFGEIEGSYGTAQFTVANGTYSVGAHWKIVDTVSLAAASGGGGITAGSYAIVGAYAELEDVTNGTSWQFGNTSAYYGNSTSSTSQNYSYALNFAGTFHLVAGHHYEIVTGLYVEVNVFVNGSKSSASASVNLGTSGDRATLKSLDFP